MIADATDLPVNADLENGGADEPKAAAQAIGAVRKRAASAARSRTSTGDRSRPIYEFRACGRAGAGGGGGGAVAAFPFVLTARAENLLYGRHDLDDTIRGLQAFEADGADVLYAPGLYE